MKRFISYSALTLCLLLESACSSNADSSKTSVIISQLQHQVDHLEAETKATASKLDEMQKSLKGATESNGKWVLWRSPRSRTGLMPFIAFYAEDAFADKPTCTAKARKRLDQQDVHIIGDDPLTGEHKNSIIVYICLPAGVPPNMKS